MGVGKSCLAVLMVTQMALPGCPGEPPLLDADRAGERARMVEHQLAERGITDQKVLAAMREVPRHRFVPEPYGRWAYEDTALPIGYDQTISQPHLVAFMTQAIGLRGGEKVLEVGTGSGYQAAVLARTAGTVYTIEILEPLARRAEATLSGLGYRNVKVRVGDGYLGWPEAAPFDAIVVTAAAEHIPQPLLEQLVVGGRLILPVGRFFQTLVLIHRTERGYEQTELFPVAFVPLKRAPSAEPSVGFPRR